MAYDGLVMAAITHELTSFVDARIEKIYQPTPSTLIISLHHPTAGRCRLLLSSEPAAPRVHLTTTKLDNPANPPMFCMLLRKYLDGGRLLLVEQYGLERIITFSFGGRDDLGNTVTYRLIAEIMGRHSNILFVDQSDRILDAILRVPPAMSSVRIVLPGLTYSYPTHQTRRDTLAVSSADQLRDALRVEPQAKLGQAMVAQLTGISPLLASELLFRAGIATAKTCAELTDLDVAQLYDQLVQLQTMVEEHRWSPSRSGKHFAALQLTHLGALPWSGTMNELVDRCLTDQNLAAILQHQKQKLSQVVRQLLQKDRRKAANQAQELEEMQQDLELRRKGELIISSLHLIPPKAEQATVIDYYDPELASVQISLNPQLTATQNAQRCFRRYERARHGIVVVEKNLAKTRATIAYLETLQDSIERADQLVVLLEIEQEMQLAELLPKPAKAKAAPANASEPLRFTSPDGIEILVGRNNLQNDRLTKSAAPNEWWLHTKDIPGSHVIVRTTAAPTRETLELAAGLAAFYSQARQSSKVPVDYTERKHVRKPSGSPPGFVIYTDQQTILATPRQPTEPKER